MKKVFLEDMILDILDYDKELTIMELQEASDLKGYEPSYILSTVEAMIADKTIFKTKENKYYLSDI